MHIYAGVLLRLMGLTLIVTIETAADKVSCYKHVFIKTEHNLATYFTDKLHQRAGIMVITYCSVLALWDTLAACCPDNFGIFVMQTT